METKQKREQFYLELVYCMLNQEIIPKDVLDNWERPEYCMGYRDNYDFEIRAFLNYIDKLNVRDANVSAGEQDEK